MNKKYKLAIVGATGLVGRTVLQVLEEKDFSNFDYTLFASKKSAGTRIQFLRQNYIVKELTTSSFDEDFDFAVFVAGGKISKEFAPIAIKNGCIVIDNSSVFRMNTDVPLVVPEVNPEAIFKNKGIIANPNCSTIQAVLPLKVLEEHYIIKRIIYSTYQAVSGAGRLGIEDLSNDINKLLPKKFPHPIYNNCLPHIDSFLDDGYTKEEYKMINETRKILGRPHLPITATAVRVPVINSHSESINVELDNNFNIDTVRLELSKSPGIVVVDDAKNNKYPLASTATGSDSVFVGRIRRDFSVRYGLNLWVVADNLRKGAATNAIQIVEKLINL